MHIHATQTPALSLDAERLQANAARILKRAADLGVSLRPHIETAKSHEIARVAHGGQFGPNNGDSRGPHPPPIYGCA
jgi:D-serine deaminase-like pyridoxal phosphate-dependent protein